MPTFTRTGPFQRDYNDLTSVDRERVKKALRLFIIDIAAKEVTSSHSFHPSLRVKPMRHRAGIWEMSWGPDGRATFELGRSSTTGRLHVTWRRIGSHKIFKEP